MKEEPITSPAAPHVQPQLSAPQVSVVIPTHNRAGMLRRTLRSVLAQTGVALEAIVVDDGSTDDTSSMVQQLGDARVSLVRHEAPRGVSAARNAGIASARGVWVAFLDDDDLWAPDKLSSQLAAAEREGCAWAYGGTVGVTGSLKVVAGAPPPPPDQVRRWLPWRNMVRDGASNVIVRRSVLDELGTFDTALRHMADWDLWIRLAQYGAPAYVSRPLVAYVLHAGNASTDTSGILPELQLLEARYAHLRGSRPADRPYVFRWIAWNLLRNGRRLEAAGMFLHAARAGDVPSLARCAAALLVPGISRRVYARNQNEPAWRAEAEAWLAPYVARGPGVAT